MSSDDAAEQRNRRLARTWPYAAPANDPWYVRIRFSLRPVPTEWARQRFMPARPYMLGTWVTGKAIAPNLIDFERRNIWFDPIIRQYPDILVYDRNFEIKYALDGVQPTLARPQDKGFLFPWRMSQVLDMDPARGRCHVGVTLSSDDIIFGFYSYAEPDFIYHDLDINPFSNPDVKSRLVRFFHKTGDPLRVIWHEIINADGSLHSTNDPTHGTGTATVIGQLTVGFSVGENEIRTEDIRRRGGGLAAEHHGIAQAQHMWDLGYRDGKPYPLGGAAVIHLPVSCWSARVRHISLRNLQENIANLGAENDSLSAGLARASRSTVNGYDRTGRRGVFDGCSDGDIPRAARFGSLMPP